MTFRGYLWGSRGQADCGGVTAVAPTAYRHHLPDPVPGTWVPTASGADGTMVPKEISWTSK